MSLEEAVAKAIKDCVDKNILADFLHKFGGEVMSMLFAEWDWEEYIAAQREEARAEERKIALGKVIAIAKEALEMGYPLEQIAKLTKLPLSEIEKLARGWQYPLFSS